MATEHNWFKTNISERLADKNARFKITVPSAEILKVRQISFHEAAKIVTRKIAGKYKKIYVPLSGGMDSEFVFNSFYELGVEITPIIVDTPCNVKESAYAFRRCEETKITPIVIRMTEEELLEVYRKEILEKLLGTGYNSVACYVATKYAKEHDGISVVAEHGFDGLNEWDFYNDALLGVEASVYFFLYTPQIYYAMLDEYRDENHQIFKHKLYGIPLRLKMKYQYSEENGKLLYDIVGVINGQGKLI
jgi:hypothetical protein